eukprot:GHVR01059768.1.p1 GENE.GHVR01059768.1~~GHVR01059768.1.p1  ORF type:complete len:104 (-),score=10.63 GHVR01059768.1:149-460(-)
MILCFSLVESLLLHTIVYQTVILLLFIIIIFLIYYYLFDYLLNKEALGEQTPNASLLFLDAPGKGGIGKTFVTNLILVKIRYKEGDIALAVASSGIAATLLKG